MCAQLAFPSLLSPGFSHLIPAHNENESIPINYRNQANPPQVHFPDVSRIFQVHNEHEPSQYLSSIL